MTVPVEEVHVPKCSYCDLPAIRQLGEIKLCLPCAEKVREIERQEFNELAALQNQAVGFINSMAGIYAPEDLIPLSQPRRPSHHIRVNSPSVGGDNYGIVSGVALGNLDNSIGKLTDEVEPDVVEGLKAFSLAISGEAALTEEQKAELAETLTALTEQLQAPKAEQKPRLAANLMKHVPTLITTSNGLVTLWNNLSVPIGRAMGIH